MNVTLPNQHSLWGAEEQNLAPLLGLNERQRQVLFRHWRGETVQLIAHSLLLDTDLVRRDLAASARSLGTAYTDDPSTWITRANLPGTRTTAEYLAQEVYSHLVGATIMRPFVSERDWGGLLLRTSDGKFCRLWIDSDVSGDVSGWATVMPVVRYDRIIARLKRSYEKLHYGREKPAKKINRRRIEAQIERLIDLLDRLDGDESLEDGGDFEPSLAGAARHASDGIVYDDLELEDYAA
jgi:hypothetical protein